MQPSPLFQVAPAYEFPWAEESDLLDQLTGEIREETELNIERWQRVTDGQNPTYQLFLPGKEQPSYLLKIPIHKGYPSFGTLRTCYTLLRKAGLTSQALLYATETSSLVPYGYCVQRWLPGTTREWIDAYEHDFSWLDDFITVLQPVHQISLTTFGYLTDGPSYPSLYEYFANMETIIDHSFGHIHPPTATLRAREKEGVLPTGFLDHTFATVQRLATSIRSTVQPVLLHGDMLPGNLLYTDNGFQLIDWDEARSGWWVYEIARVLYFCPYPGLLDYFLERYPTGAVPRAEIDIAIRLEHVRQSLRQLCIYTFNSSDRDQARAAAAPYVAKVNTLLHQNA